MPSHHSHDEDRHAPQHYGQIIEYIQEMGWYPDRLYLASYTSTPNAHTPFPYPASRERRSPSKRSAKAQSGPTSPSKSHPPPVYFSVERTLLYNAFHADFGPFHIGHLYRFAVQLHEVLGDPNNEDRPVVFWSSADSRSRANSACLLACYMVLIQNWPPHLALAPIAQMDPPCMPFRDAGYSQADYVLNIQDVVYGVWKAKEEGICSLKDFSLEEYEKYERVDMGDFNWISPDFLAFASPQFAPAHVIPPSSPIYPTIPKTVAELQHAKIPTPFKNVLSHFSTRNIGLVVRLNSELYSPSYFTALGIQHLDMIFDDGTCPPLHLVRNFVNLAHEMITVRKKGIAVHCKAGLGRTGCLIGAYLIYKHGFTANEIIAFMRFMRPGMVVGPQQHWLHLNQGTFREWWFEDCMKEKLAALQQAPATPTKGLARNRLASNGQTHTPPNNSPKRSALGEISSNDQRATSMSGTGVNDENLPAPTPGQPRKTSKLYGNGSTRHKSPRRVQEEEPYILPDVEAETSPTKGVSQDGPEEDEEAQLRLLAKRAASRSPSSKSPKSVGSNTKRRAVSCTTTTTTSTTTTTWGGGGGNESDVENRSLRPKTPSGKSGSGSGAISVGKTRSTPARRSTEAKTGVRKTSGRVGSLGSTRVK